MSRNICGLAASTPWIFAAISTLALFVRVQPTSLYPSYERRRVDLPSYGYQTEPFNPHVEIESEAAQSPAELLKKNSLQEYVSPGLGQRASAILTGRYKWADSPFLPKRFEFPDNQFGEVLDQSRLLRSQDASGGRYLKTFPIVDGQEWDEGDSSPLIPIDGVVPQAQSEDGEIDSWQKGFQNQGENPEKGKVDRISDNLEFRRKREINKTKRDVKKENDKKLECSVWFRLCSPHPLKKRRSFNLIS